MSAPVMCFDAYGTLFDVHAASNRLRGEIGPHADRLSQIWRTKTLEYTWIAALTGRHASFYALSEQALDFAIASTAPISEPARAKLLSAYIEMEAFPEARDVLLQLKAKGHKLAILTNGDPLMIERAITSAALSGLFGRVITVHEAQIFKPAPQVYALVTQAFDVAPSDIEFVSSNRWDVAGAHAFGFKTLWLNRSRTPDEYPSMPADRVATDLQALL